MKKHSLEKTISSLKDKAKNYAEMEHLDDVQFEYCQDQAALCTQIAEWLEQLVAYKKKEDGSYVN